MAPDGLEILYEDNHLLVVNKPPGLPTMGVTAGEASLIALAKQYIKRRYHKPGNVYLGVVSRLDAGTSGAVVFARTSKAAARLSEQFRTRGVRKTYWAVASGEVDPPQAELVDWLIKDETAQRMSVVDAAARGAKEARLAYRVLKRVAGGTVLEIDLHSGRKHQIRVQLASRGYPLWGERKYGRGRPFGAHLGLHARRLEFEHPTLRTRIDIEAPPPATWKRFGV
jgi:23S rRNA pseudouridine1911/1915/1917 synthase